MKKEWDRKQNQEAAELSFQYNKDSLFDVLSESVDDYAFVGNLKTGEFMYSYKMMLDFGLPGQVIPDAAAFWGEKVHPEDVHAFMKSNQDIAEGREDGHNIVYRARNEQGEWVHLLCKGQMIRDAKGNPDLFAGIIRNLDKKVASDNEELQVISDSSTDGIFKAAMSEGFPLLYGNDGYFKIHGYTRTQMATELSNQAEKLVAAEDLERVQKKISEDIEAQKSQIVLEYRIRRRDGEIAWVHVNAGIMPMEGQPSVMIGMIMDITERRKLEEHLMRTEELFKVARKYTRLSMWEYDAQKKRIIQTEESQVTHGFESIVENVPESLIESGFVHPESAEAMRRLYRELEEGKPVASAAVRVKTPNKKDEYWWEKITYTNIRKSEGKVVWAIGLSEDITAQREAEIRVFKEETMRELLTEELFFSFRINMTGNCVEKLWDHMEDRAETDFAEIGYEEIFCRISASIANEDDRKRFQTNYSLKKIHQYMQNKKAIPDFEFRRKQKNGHILWVALNFKLATSPESGDEILFGYLKNIDSLKKRELSLQRKAEIDEISGLYNFPTAKMLIEGILEKEESQASKGALLLLNVDNFKEINQKDGFLTGNRFLRIFSEEISKSLTLPSIKARVNWDLFLIFFSDTHKDKSFLKMAEELRESLCKTYSIGGKEFSVTVSAGMAEQFTEGMTFVQMYQYALHALNGAKRSGKNRLMRYRDIETMVEGLDIQMIVDAEDYSILELNTTGQIALGIKEGDICNRKCYEVLHNRTEQCPFCNERQKKSEDRVWECFVPPLNRIMHVTEKLRVENEKHIKIIQLQEGVQDKKKQEDIQNIFQVLEECWLQTEKGESREKVLGTFLKSIGEIFRAARVLIYEEEPYKNEMRLQTMWKVHGVSEESHLYLHTEVLLELFQKAFPANTLLIEDENSKEYEAVRKFYGEAPMPLPVMITGIYENNKPFSFLVIEGAEKNEEAMNALSLAAGFMRRTYRLHELSKNYTHALQRDYGTGLLNYRSYMQYLHNANNDVHSAFGIAEVNVVDLKGYNEKYGIKTGDSLLGAMSHILVEIWGRELTFRVSGAHFRVLCPDMTYENFSQKCRMLEEWIEKNYPGMFVTGSVWEQSAISVERLQEQVEEKTAVARTRMRDENRGESTKTVGEMRNGLLQALANGDFHVFLQPKAQVETGEICGAEALVRYIDKEKGVIPPGRFLPAIEKAGLIRYIDLFILQQVCRIIKGWLEEGHRPLPVSLNYSRTTFLEPGILEETNNIVEKSGIPKELLEIEITETISSIDTVGLQNIVNQFAEAGYGIAMDDFGAEYSNIHVLYSLKLNTLKLDRRIISDIYHDNKARLVVENVINMCKKLGIVALAEGVETEEHIDVLKSMSCDVMQGYYLNKPLPDKDFSEQYIR